MAFNVLGQQGKNQPQIPFSLFGGLNSELAGPTLPEGLSPDCQDVMFKPGNVFTRDPLSKLFNPGYGLFGWTYGKTYLQPDGDPLNLFLDSQGIMRQQDVLNNPAVASPIFTTVPNLYANSVTAFGREYITCHDGLTGKDIPRQYDGTNWYRVTQDGPGAASTVADAAETTIPISTIIPLPAVPIATITLGDGFITVVTTTPHGLAVGAHVLITGNSTFQFNGPETVATVPNATSFTYTSLASGLTQGTGGELIPDTVTVTTTIDHGLISGETITIAGNSDSNYNNSTGASAISNTVGLAGGAATTFYPNSDSNGGAFPWCFGGEGPNLPGTIGNTFNFSSNQSLMMNPNTDLGGTNLTGYAVTNHGETNGNGIWIPGVTNGSIPPPATTNNGSYVQSGTTAKLYILDNNQYGSGNPVLSAAFAFGTLQVKFSGYTGSGGPSFLEGQTVTVTNVGSEHLSNHDDPYWFIEFNQPSGSHSIVGNPATWSIAFTLIPAAGFAPGSGAWDGTEQQWQGFGFGDGSITASFKKDFAAVTAGTITVSAPGNVTFKVVHKEGVIIGIGGGALYVSGPMNNPRTQTHSALKGYPIVYANNASTEFYHVSIFNAQFTMNFPAAGSYPIEIDYAQWHHSRPTFSLQFENAMSAFVPIGPGVVAFATPATWTVGNVLGPTTFQFDAVYAVGSGFGGTITVGGLVSPGIHGIGVSFLTDTDYITVPGPTTFWASAGSKRFTVSNLPIGPSNVKGRVIIMTGSGGRNFFTLLNPAVDPTTGQQISTSLLVPDNTSTSYTFDIADNTLFAGIAVDITGNNLFAQVILGQPARVESYSNRLLFLNDINKIGDGLGGGRLRGMGFEGGVPSVGNTTTPLGWNVSANIGGALVPGEFGLGWRITGNGFGQRGMIYQSAYEDSGFTAITQPSTQYTFQCFAYSSIANPQGTLVAEFFSPSMGSLATASILANSLGVTQAKASFVQMNFNATTPATIPPDMQVRFYTNNLGNLQQVTIDELAIISTVSPQFLNALVSYSNNPEAIDGVTGPLETEYSEPMRGSSIIRDNLYLGTSGHLVRTVDTGIGEPSTWPVHTVADAGLVSLRSMDTGEEGWGIIASPTGLMVWDNSEPQKISQEIQSMWDAIDPNLRQHVWIKNDPIKRRILVGVPCTRYVPTGTKFAPLSCNRLYVMDYRELNTAGAVKNAPPLHISMTGKMLSSDLTRKWTVYTLPMNFGERMVVPNSEPVVVVGSGNGLGLTGGFGNAYFFLSIDDDPDLRPQFLDDDYGQIGANNGESTLTYAQWIAAGKPGNLYRPNTAYYVTYFGPSHEQEQMLNVGANRKMFGLLSGFIEGVGFFQAIPLIDRVGNSTNRPPRLRTLSLTPNNDLEFPLNIRANRMALLLYAVASIPTNPPPILNPPGGAGGGGGGGGS